MRDVLRDPVDRSPLVREAAGLRSASGRLYPPRAGGWDLRPEAAGGTGGEHADNPAHGPARGPAHDAAHAATQADIYDAMTGEASDFDYPHNLTLVHQRGLLETLPLGTADTVLEIGGHRSGVLAWLERHRGIHGFGLDISPAWVAAQNQACGARGARSSWVVGNAERLPFADVAFKAIVAFDVFEHLGNLRAAIEECVRVLASGGVLVCHMPVADIDGSFDGFQRWSDAAGFAARQASVGHYHERMPSRRLMRTMLEQAGLHVLDTRNFNVWLQPLHDHRLMPALGRLRHRKDKPPAQRAAGASPPEQRPPGASRFQRAYATSVLPIARALTGIDEVGALLGFGGSCSFVARKPL